MYTKYMHLQVLFLWSICFRQGHFIGYAHYLVEILWNFMYYDDEYFLYPYISMQAYLWFISIRIWVTVNNVLRYIEDELWSHTLTS